MGKRIMYFDLVELIEQYIDQVGITKACADIMTVLTNRLYDKLKVIGPLKEENESHLPQTPQDGHLTSARTRGWSLKGS